ncbi:MAG TPA: serine/threonine-protein kinase [Chthoniobacteraceae bacterium]|nr:serine/threonine-protein kinase [Chthoniobacteraceae bacterium]
MSSHDPRVEAIFHEALERAPAERGAFIAKECEGDESLQREIQRLLIAYEDASTYFEPPNSPEIEAELARLKPEEAGEWIGNYKLLQQIGEGGFGVVWMAEQEKPVRRRVALKIIKMGMDTKEVIARFEQERQALAMMDHPNIARVFEAGATPFGRPFFAMELVRGIKITDYCDKAGMGMRERLELFIHVCRAVQHAHQKGIIHRDLKPSNILVTLNDGEAVPKVIDFGVAKAMQGRLTDRSFFTEFDQMVGTLMYMSPEQAEMTSLDIDTRSDIYALGVLLYELLTGRTPIDSETIEHEGRERVRQIIREVDPLRPSIRIKALTGAELTTTAKRRHATPAKLSGLIRGDLDWIVMTCLEKDRNRRYDSANSLALDIQRHLEGKPVIARPPTYSYLLGRFIRRNKLVTSAAAAVVASLIIGAGVSWWQASRALTAAQQARAAENDTKAFADFLVKRILAAARPQDLEGGLGIDVTVLSALEQAGKRLEEDFYGRPRAEAVAREALGVTWETLGRYDEAAAQLEEASKLHETTSGPNAPATLKALNDLAVVYQKAGKPEKAHILYEKVLQRRKETLSRQDPALILSINNLAGACLDEGDIPTALVLYEEAFAMGKSALLPDDPNMLKIMSNQARAWKLSDAANNALSRKALPLYKSAYDASVVKLGADNPDTLTCMNNLAVCYQQAGQIDSAMPLFEEAFKLSKVKLGPDHMDTLITMNNLAGACFEKGEIGRAIELYAEALGKSRIKPGPDHRDTLELIANLAVAYEKYREFPQAIPLYLEALEKRTARYGPEHRVTLKAMNNLGVAYGEAGELEQGLPYFEKSYAGRNKLFGPSDPETLISMFNVALIYLRMENFQKSLACFEDLLAIQRKRLGDGDPEVKKLEKQIGEVRAKILVGDAGKKTSP